MSSQALDRHFLNFKNEKVECVARKSTEMHFKWNSRKSDRFQIFFKKCSAISLYLSHTWSTARKVIWTIIKLCPYKINFVQNRQDLDRRTHFARILLARLSFNKWMTLGWDEENFTQEEPVNAQKCRVWGTERLNVAREMVFHSNYITYICCMIRFYDLIHPLLFSF